MQSIKSVTGDVLDQTKILTISSVLINKFSFNILSYLLFFEFMDFF